MNNNSPDSWMPMRMFPPQTFEVLEVKLADDTVRKALWTGAKWWCGKEMVEPQAWRLIEEPELRRAS